MLCSKLEIGGRVAKLREQNNLSQKELANALHVSRETVAKWENGSRDLKTEHTAVLADYFETNCDYILRGIDSANVDVRRDLGLTDSAIDVLRYLNESKASRTKTAHNVLHTINFLLEQMDSINIFGAISKYFTCEYEALPVDEDILKNLGMISIETGSRNLKNSILVREKSTGQIASFSVDNLPDIFINQMPILLLALKSKYKEGDSHATKNKF